MGDDVPKEEMPGRSDREWRPGCPVCGTAMPPPRETDGGLIRCPGCGEEFPPDFRREDFLRDSSGILLQKGHGGLSLGQAGPELAGRPAQEGDIPRPADTSFHGRDLASAGPEFRPELSAGHRVHTELTHPRKVKAAGSDNWSRVGPDVRFARDRRPEAPGDRPAPRLVSDPPSPARVGAPDDDDEDDASDDGKGRTGNRGPPVTH